MIERTLDISTPSGSMETFIVHPQASGPHPAVVLYMDVWGIREELRDIARRIATVGYYCLLPDLYYRQGTVRTEYRDKNNRMVSMDRLAEPERQIAAAPLAKLSDAMVIADTQSLLQFIDNGEPVRPGAPRCDGRGGLLHGRTACVSRGRGFSRALSRLRESAWFVDRHRRCRFTAPDGVSGCRGDLLRSGANRSPRAAGQGQGVAQHHMEANVSPRTAPGCRSWLCLARPRCASQGGSESRLGSDIRHVPAADAVLKNINKNR